MATEFDIQFKPIPGFPNYVISNKFGIIINKATNKQLKTPRNNCGYFQAALYDENHKRHVQSVSRWVALAWIPNPDNLSDVAHISEDGRYSDHAQNNVENLMWMSHKDNVNSPKHKERVKKLWDNPKWREKQLEALKEGRRKKRERDQWLIDNDIQLF